MDSQPAPGSEIASGSAITLFVSAGPPDEDGDEEDEGDEADEEDDSGDGPGKSEKAHGKGKAKK